jgi:hypothetical protein
MGQKFKYNSRRVTQDVGKGHGCVLNHCYILKMTLTAGHTKCECAGTKLVFVLVVKGSDQQVDCFVV